MTYVCEFHGQYPAKKRLSHLKKKTASKLVLQFEPVEAEVKFFCGKDQIAGCRNETTFHTSNHVKAGALAGLIPLRSLFKPSNNKPEDIGRVVGFAPATLVYEFALYAYNYKYTQANTIKTINYYYRYV